MFKKKFLYLSTQKKKRDQKKFSRAAKHFILPSWQKHGLREVD